MPKSIESLEEKMAERDLNEDSSKNDDEEDLETNDDSMLAALNFVLILSTLSSSPVHDEERLSFEEIEERESGNRNRRGRHGGWRSDLPTSRRQQVSGCSRALERNQMSKIQTKIRDCRHSRRL